ncbi:MAG: Crp/Fnr family transcriptional regulator [Deltaproteobacteria bacterium]|jgi:CRP-like cAMP-binding protein|nr:Crp/Fnr family transcriptional regulator [Deltaproteobacteria bacterium]
MVSAQDLKGIELFAGLTDGMLDKLAPLVQTESFDERAIIYETGNPAERFYSLKRGKVLLETELAPAVIISLGSIKPGYSFGWEALRPPASYATYAVCTEPCDVYMVPGDKFLGLLDADHTMGYLVMQKTARILENRLRRRSAQFLKVLSKHPEIGALLGL